MAGSLPAPRLAGSNPAAHLPDLGNALHNLGIRLWTLDRRDEAVAPTHEATETYRRLATANPAAYLPNLATALNSLAIRLLHVGRLEQAAAENDSLIWPHLGPE